MSSILLRAGFFLLKIGPSSGVSSYFLLFILIGRILLHRGFGQVLLLSPECFIRSIHLKAINLLEWY